MQLIRDFPPKARDFDDGLDDVLMLLRALEASGIFSSQWFGPHGTELWSDVEGFRSVAGEQNAPDADRQDGRYALEIGHGAYDPKDTAAFVVRPVWGDPTVTMTTLEISMQKPHPVLGTPFDMFEQILTAVLRWRRPVHMSWAWARYRKELAPLDSQRRCLGWMGWVPFDLSGENLEQAAVLRALEGGTFVAPHPTFWFSHGDQADDAAIRNAQSLDHALNRLGVLPSLVDLRSGAWPPERLRQ